VLLAWLPVRTVPLRGGLWGSSIRLPSLVLFWMGLLGVDPLGLSLNSRRSIGVAPVRGGTYFLCRRKESKQRKRAHTASS
ncbi:hypothetical protein, partial [Mesorhizobium sp. M3A.F.Ca.ET.174.01.1.1]|uniref:hypothetical protein n=1 Tax=Mesorhizobium sp. M3A.F.Ca.ET.174.01.1.1 TaxID=2563944 RepID=UPI001AEE1CAF